VSLLHEAVSQLSQLTVCAVSSAVATPLDFEGCTQTENNDSETVSALIGAARGGDPVAISHLSSLGEVAARMWATRASQVSVSIIFITAVRSESDFPNSRAW